MQGKTPVAVLVFGTFDLLHLGHIAFLRQAKHFGTHLTVAVSRDAAVKNVKGAMPFFKQEERAALIRELGLVDRVLIGKNAEFRQAIRLIHPQVICLGYDQKAYVRELNEFLTHQKLPVRVVRLRPHAPTRYKTARIKAL